MAWWTRQTSNPEPIESGRHVCAWHDETATFSLLNVARAGLP